MKKIILALATTLSLTAFAQIEPGTVPADKSEGPGAIQKSEPAVMPSEKHKTHKVTKKSHKKSHHRKAHKKATK